MTKPEKHKKKDDLPARAIATAGEKANKADDQVAELKHELQAKTETLQRLSADYANYQKRVEADTENVAKRASHNLLTKLFPIFDNFYLAVRHKPASIADKPNLTDEERRAISLFIDGVALIERQLEETLGGLGLRPIGQTGEAFDPARHEAISYEPNDLPAETVITALETGWELDGVVIKPAKVRVSQGH